MWNGVSLGEKNTKAKPRGKHKLKLFWSKRVRKKIILFLCCLFVPSSVHIEFSYFLKQTWVVGVSDPFCLFLWLEYWHLKGINNSNVTSQEVFKNLVNYNIDKSPFYTLFCVSWILRVSHQNTEKIFSDPCLLLDNTSLNNSIPTPQMLNFLLS